MFSNAQQMCCVYELTAALLTFDPKLISKAKSRLVFTGKEGSCY